MKCLINRKNWWWLKIFKNHFDIVPADIYTDCSNQYNPNEHFVFIDDGKNQQAIDYWTSRGFKTVAEEFWEQLVDDPRGVYVEDGCLHLYTKNWVWMDLALHNQYRNYNYVRLEATTKHFFLMLMNLRKVHRDQLFDVTQPYHVDSLYSYVERGIFIQGDVPPTGSNQCAGTSDQGFYNPNWYSDTCFSMVAESQVNGKRFISEKIFKPLAFQHPFIVYGTANTLSHLHDLGFETFEHAIDESYDSIDNSQLRLQAIQQVLKDLHLDYKQGTLTFADSISQQKLQHNYNKFYDIQRLWQKEIVEPIKEFVNA